MRFTFALIFVLLLLPALARADQPQDTHAALIGKASSVQVQHTADDMITLTLKPGYQGPKVPGTTDPDVFLGKPELPNAPPKLAVIAPLYPGAVPITPSRGEVGSYPGTPYLWSAFIAYDLPTNPESALAWYSKSFAAAGFSNGGRTVNSERGPDGVQVSNTSIEFDQPDGMAVQLDVKDGDKGHTIASYFATAIGNPSRPPQSLISNAIKSVEVKYQSVTDSDSFTKKITNAADIASLISAFNALQIDTRGEHGCAKSVYDWIITFKNPDGLSREVDVNPACNAVDTGLKNYGLFDETESMDKLLKTVTGAKAPH